LFVYTANYCVAKYIRGLSDTTNFSNNSRYRVYSGVNMRLISTALSSTVLAIVLSSSASAANVTDVQGQVQLSNSGGPFKAISGPTTCKAGDVVRVVKDGSATVVNQNGVIQTATPGNPVVCLAGPGPAGAPPTAAAPSAAAGSASSVSTAAVVGGSIAVVAGVAGVVALTKKKSSASP
jgi:hypothetical protein